MTKIVLLYGPPAVGKLTVGEELVSLTGLPLLHNHLLTDLAASLFGRGSPSCSRLTRHFRHLMLEEVLRASMPGLIVTLVYAKDREGYIAELCQFIEDYGGMACLVHLYCDQTTLEARVTNESRKRYDKLVTVSKL